MLPTAALPVMFRVVPLMLLLLTRFPPTILPVAVTVVAADMAALDTTLPPVTLPVAVTVVAADMAALDTTLPAVRLPVALMVVAADMAALLTMLPPVTLPVAATKPVVLTLPAITVPVASSVMVYMACVAVILAADRLPVSDKLLPTALPMLGVTRLAPVLTMMLPVPSNAVVLLSTLAENTVPLSTKPAAVLAEYTWLAENCVNSMAA